MGDPQDVARLTLISQVNDHRGGAPLLLDEPVWLQPGQRYWLNDARNALIVEDATSCERSYPCSYGSGPDALR